MWNYAQYFALNDNHYTSQFGPSTPGALNLVSGQTNGLAAWNNNVFSGSPPSITLLHGTHEAGGDPHHLEASVTVIGDGDPFGDVSGARSWVDLISRSPTRTARPAAPARPIR